MKLKIFALMAMPLAVALSGCDSKRDEDVAAIRAHMEKEAAEKQAAQERAKEKFKVMRSNAEKSAQNQGH